LLAAVGRPAAAGRDRARPRHRSSDPAGGRADREPRFAGLRGGARDLPGAERPGEDGPPDHPRGGHRASREAHRAAQGRRDRQRPRDRSGAGRLRDRRGGRMRNSVLRTTNIVKVGLRSILRNKMRSSLTMLGIIIGVGCVIAMNAVGSGASESIQSNINSLGANFIMVFPGAVTQSGARIFAATSSLTEDDAKALKEECPSVAYVSPGARTGAPVVAGENNWSTEIYGAGVDWPFIRAWNVAKGSFFSESEVKSGAKVAVLGQSVVQNLFPDSEPVGSVIRIKNVPFRVVGVLERKGGNMMGSDQDDQIIVPYTTVMKRLMGSPRLNLIQVAAKSSDAVQSAMD